MGPEFKAWLWKLSQKWFTLVSSNLDTKIPSKQKKKIDILNYNIW